MANKKSNVVALPKKVKDVIAVISGKEVKFNFGLSFAMHVQNYKKEEFEDNLSYVAGSLIDGDLDILTGLIAFATEYDENVTVEGVEAYLEEEAEKDGLENLFDVFFNNLLASPFLKQSMQFKTEVLLLAKEAAKYQSEQLIQQAKTEIEKMKTTATEK